MWGLLPDSATVGVARRLIKASSRSSRRSYRYSTPNLPPRWEDTVILVVEADPDED
jgi:hypothetical protein